MQKSCFASTHITRFTPFPAVLFVAHGQEANDFDSLLFPSLCLPIPLMNSTGGEYLKTFCTFVRFSLGNTFSSRDRRGASCPPSSMMVAVSESGDGRAPGHDIEVLGGWVLFVYDRRIVCKEGCHFSRVDSGSVYGTIPLQ